MANMNGFESNMKDALEAICGMMACTTDFAEHNEAYDELYMIVLNCLNQIGIMAQNDEEEWAEEDN